MLRAFFLIFALVAVAWVAVFGFRGQKSGKPEIEIFPDMTMRNHFPLMRYSPTLRFTVFGAIAYTAFSIVGVLISLRSMARIVHFTEASMLTSNNQFRPSSFRRNGVI